MNVLKESLKKKNIIFMITYADNLALGFFKKQGFSKNLTAPPPIWQTYVKDYDGSTQMECLIHPTINYIELRKDLKSMKNLIQEIIKASPVSSVEFSVPAEMTLKVGHKSESPSIADLVQKLNSIPDLAQVGYRFSADELEELKKRKVEENFQSLCFRMITKLKTLKNAWPFEKPVTDEEAPGYSEIIEKPMDLSTLNTKLNTGVYRSREEFSKDLDLIPSNAKYFNTYNSPYYRYAEEMEEEIDTFWEKNIPNYVPES